MKKEYYPGVDDNVSSFLVDNDRKFFAVNQDKVFFSPFYEDIIYEVNIDSIKPIIAFDFGKYKFSIEEMGSVYSSGSILFGINVVYVGDQYIWFQFFKSMQTYTGFYSFKTKKIKLYQGLQCDMDEYFLVTGALNIFDKRFGYQKLDIETIYSIKESFERLGVLEEGKVSDEKKVFYEKYLKDLSIEDNPIIVKVKVKEF